MRVLRYYWKALKNPQSVPLWVEVGLASLTALILCLSIAFLSRLFGRNIDSVSISSSAFGWTLGFVIDAWKRRHPKAEAIAESEAVRQHGLSSEYIPSAVMKEGTMVIQSEPPPVIPGASFIQ